MICIELETKTFTLFTNVIVYYEIEIIITFELSF